MGRKGSALHAGFVPASARCAACALGCFALQQLLGSLGRLWLSAWLAGTGAGALGAAYEARSWGVTLLAGTASLCLPVWAAVRFGGLPRRMLGLQAPVRGVTLPALVLYLGAAEWLNVAAAAAGERAGSVQQVALPRSGPALLLAFLSLCAVPPLFEELLFRGAAQGFLRPYGPWLAVTAQAVLFALLHESISAAVFALPAGLFFGYLAERTHSLLPGMLLHFANNCMAFVLMALSAAGLESFSRALQAWLLILLPLAAAGAAVWIWRRRKNVFRPLAAGASPLWLLRSPAYLAAAAFLAVFPRLWH